MKHGLKLLFYCIVKDENWTIDKINVTKISEIHKILQRKACIHYWRNKYFLFGQSVCRQFIACYLSFVSLHQ